MESTWLIDITENFTRAANQLQIGEMIHTEDFSLQKTLTAVLVGDPFFDKNLSSIRKDQNSIPCEQLDDNQFNDLMCQFIAYFTSWLDGQSFFQTIYSCVYLRQIESLNNQRLRNFLLLALKACQSVDNCIIEAQVVEEEDFVLCRPLLESIVWSNIEADYLLAQQFVESCWNESNIWNKPLQLFYYFCKIMDSNMVMNQSLEEYLQDIIAAKETLQDISFVSNKESMETITMACFDVGLPQVSHNEIPRNITPYTFSEAQQRLCYLLTELEEWIDFIQKCAIQLQTANHLFPLLWNIFHFNRSKRHILTRSLLYHKLCASRCGMMGTTWNFTAWLKNVGWNVWHLRSKDWGLDSISKLNHIIHRLDYLIQNIFRILCLNRGKQRRKLLNLLSHVEQVYMQSIGNEEETIQDNPLSLWIQELGYMISIQHLLLGFDCDLYDTTEYSAVYFVLGYLFECWSNIMSRSSSFLCWQSQQQRQLWNSWILLCSKLYRCSCLLWEWEQQRKQQLWNNTSQMEQRDNHERDPLFIHPLAFELRFSALATRIQKVISYSLFHEEMVEPMEKSFYTQENILRYWLEPLDTLFESMKKILEHLVKEEKCFYFMDSNKELLRWSIHHLVYFKKAKLYCKKDFMESCKVSMVPIQRQFYLPQLEKITTL